MKVLVSLLTDDVDDIHLARRKVAYQRLVLVVHPGAQKIAETVSEAERGDVVDTVYVDTGGVDEALDRIRSVVDDLHPDDEVTLNAAGGHAGLVTAMILLAYEQGLETLFLQEGHVEQLPVLEGVRLEDRLGDAEQRLLSADIGTRPTLGALRSVTGWPKRKVERICRKLEDKDLGWMRLKDGQAAFQLSQTGEWVRKHLGGSRANEIS